MADEHFDADLARGLLAGAAAVVAAVEPDGTVSAVTPAVEEVLGFTAGEIEGRPLSRLVDPNDRTTIERARQRVENEGTGASVHERVRLRHADGNRYVHALSLSNRLADPTAGALVATIERPAPRPPDGTVDHLALPILSLDERWAVRHANDAAAELLGRPGADARGGVLWDLLPDAVVSTFSERLREAVRSGRRVSFTVSPPIADRAFAVTAVPLDDGVLVYATPEPDDAVTALDDALERSILESLEDGLCVLAGSTIEYANAALFEHLSATALEGRRFASVVDEALVEAVRERSAEPIRRMDPLEYVHEPSEPADRGGRDDSEPTHRRRFEVFVTSLADDRTLCLFRPAARSPTAQLDLLRNAVSALDDDPPSRRRLRQSAVDAMVDAFALDGAYWLVGDGAEFRPEEVSGAIEPGTAAASSPPIAGDDPRIRDAVEVGEPSIVETAWPGGPSDPDALPGVAILVPVAGCGVVVARPDGTERAVRSRGPIVSMDLFAAHVGTVADALDARLDRFDADRARTRVETTVASLTEAEAVVDRAFDALLAARTRADVDRALCHALDAIDAVELGWVGDVDLTVGAVTPREAIGNAAYVEAVEASIAAAAEPSGRAVHERNPVEVRDVAAERAPDNWAVTALEYGFRSALSVPLSFDSVVYGTLSAYATEPNAFDRHRRRAVVRIASLGAFVLAGLDVRRALAAETVTELEVLADDDADPLTRFVAAVGLRVDVLAVVPRDGGRSTVYCTAESIPPVALDGLADGVEGLSAIRRRGRPAVPESAGATATFALTCADETLASRIIEHGGSVRTIEPYGDRTRIGLEVLPDRVRRTLEALQADFGPLDLRIRRTRERSQSPSRPTASALLDALTDRQVQTLAAAYHGGYFEWPRERTGEEIARTLGVSQPTFNRHFRAAERSLFSTLFDDADDLT